MIPLETFVNSNNMEPLKNNVYNMTPTSCGRGRGRGGSWLLSRGHWGCKDSIAATFAWVIYNKLSLD
uniref:Ovule protein n=1 Tax=Heterorhabditis bacteriophora TaxID=37862 RepID=A0A1I7X4A0_HETBA